MSRESIELSYEAVRSVPKYAPMHDEAIQSVYEAILRPGDVVVDGGAHAGKHTIPMAFAVGPHGSVLAFEPLVEARTRLHNSLTEHSLSNVIVSDSALSDVPGQTVEFLYFPRRPGISGFLRREGVDVLAAEPREAVTTTIDLIAADRDVRFMKLDVEGAELLALRGANSVVERCRPLIHVEAGIVSWRPFGFSAADLHFWCALRSYRCFDLISNEMTHRGDLEASFTTGGVWDYILVPREFPLQDVVIHELRAYARRFGL